MSGDEFFAQIASIVFSLVAWGRWIYLRRKLAGFDLNSGTPSRWHQLIPAACIISVVGLLGVLVFWSSYDVRESVVYIFFYMTMGIAAIPVGIGLLGKLGLSLRDDVIERRNPAARLALSGAIIGFTAAYAGSNIGDGPGWWVVVVCTGLAHGSLLLAWCILTLTCRVADRITIDRDEATGLRIGGWFIASGLILGRAAAGNWEGMSGAWTDFLSIAWGAWLLMAIAMLFESVLGGSQVDRNDNQRGFSTRAINEPASLLTKGLIPAVIQLGLAWLFLDFFGRW